MDALTNQSGEFLVTGSEGLYVCGRLNIYVEIINLLKSFVDLNFVAKHFVTN